MCRCCVLAYQYALTRTSFSLSQVFPVTEKTYIGLPGLGSDVATLRERFRYRLNMYKMKEERTIEPETFAHLVSSTLYERRYVHSYVLRGLSCDRLARAGQAERDNRARLGCAPCIGSAT